MMLFCESRLLGSVDRGKRVLAMIVSVWLVEALEAIAEK